MRLIVSLVPIGDAVNVSVIAPRSGTNTVIVAGTFETAGSLACSAICSWDTSETKWSALGAGLQSGEVRSVAFGDVSQMWCDFCLRLLNRSLLLTV